MKWLILITLFIPALVQAAIPATIDLQAAKEIVSLPEQNRIIVAKSHPNPKLLDQLLVLAFEPKEDFQTRWKALTFAAKLGGKSVVSEIDKACNAKEWFMKNACLVSLESIDQSKAIHRARTLLLDKALVVRSAAVQILAKRNSPDIRDLLWKQLNARRNFRNTESLWIRSEIVKVLAAEPDVVEKTSFMTCLRDADPRLYSSSIHALEKLSKKNLGSRHASLDEKRALWLKTTVN